MQFLFKHYVISTLIGCSVLGCGNSHENPRAAYIRAIKNGDYTLYRKSALNPLPEAEFTMRCDQIKSGNLPQIKEEDLSVEFVDSEDSWKVQEKKRDSDGQ